MNLKTDLIPLDLSEQLVIGTISIITYMRSNGDTKNITIYQISKICGLDERTVKSVLLRLKNKLKIKEFFDDLQ